VAGGNVCVCRAIAAFNNPARPAAALVCPMLALTELRTAAGASGSASRRAVERAFSSVASPTLVPVPCPSK
jgi:hypothetical protein